MNSSELKKLVNRALEKLYACDYELITGDASEWSVAHRLAVYLEQEIPGWHVDCEYNRQGNDFKIKRTSGVEPTKDNNIRPDIIIHHRGVLARAGNLLVVEMKKTKTTSDSTKVCEYTKIHRGQRHFQYQFGLALSLTPRPKLDWFENGKLMSRDVINS